MKRSLLFEDGRRTALIYAGMGLIAATYGLVRLAYGLFLPDVQDALSLSSAAAGYVSAGASVAYCVGALCGLSAATRSRRLVLGALLTAAVGSAGMAAAPGLAVFVPAAILGSSGAGLASPGLVAMVERNIRASDRGRAQAVVNAGTGPGLVVAGLLALLVLPQWRVGFAISAVLTAVVGTSVLLLDRRGATGSTAPRERLPAVPTEVSDRTWRWVRQLVTPAIAAALLGAASAVVWTYGRTLLLSHGATGPASMLAWIALGVGGTATVVTSRALSVLHPARAWAITVAAVAASIATLALAGGNLVAAMVACAVFGWGFVAATSALIAWTASLVPDRAAPGTSLLFVTLVLGQAVGSAVAGVVTGGRGPTTAFLLAAGTAALAASCGQRRAGGGPRSSRDGTLVSLSGSTTR